jgi:hypothetical protein
LACRDIRPSGARPAIAIAVAALVIVRGAGALIRQNALYGKD